MSSALEAKGDKARAPETEVANICLRDLIASLDFSAWSAVLESSAIEGFNVTKALQDDANKKIRPVVALIIVKNGIGRCEKCREMIWNLKIVRTLVAFSLLRGGTNLVLGDS